MEAESNIFQFIRFMQTARGWIWLSLVIIAVFLVAEPDEGEVTAHTQFLLVCFACLCMIPDLSQERETKRDLLSNSQTSSNG